MKTSLLLTTAFGLVLAGSASGQTTVRITGAQAFGDAVHRAIKNVLTANGAFTYAYTGTDVNKAQQTVWTGTLAGSPVVIKTSWNGSTAGIRVVTKNTPLPFLVNATSQSAAGTSLPTTGNTTENLAAEAAAVDTFQSSTIYSSPVLEDRIVGAGAYVFVAGKDAPANFTNITALQAKALYATGALPLALFTGAAADRTALLSGTWASTNLFGGEAHPVQVFATGRDYESGARLVALVETGIGGDTAIAQYKPVIGTGSPVPTDTIASHALYPAVTINGIAFAEGSDGNTSNGNLATTVLPKKSLSTLGGFYVSYLPTLDAANSVTAGAARILAYNGVPYTPANVSEGAYSLWAYEHLLWKPSVSAAQKSVLEALANRLLTADATLLVSALQVSRPIDGGIITNTY